MFHIHLLVSSAVLIYAPLRHTGDFMGHSPHQFTMRVGCSTRLRRVLLAFSDIGLNTMLSVPVKHWSHDFYIFLSIDQKISWKSIARSLTLMITVLPSSISRLSMSRTYRYRRYVSKNHNGFAYNYTTSCCLSCMTALLSYKV